MDHRNARNALCHAAMEGLLSGLALLACTPSRTTTVTAPMEPAGSGATGPASTGRSLPLAVPDGLALDPIAKDCCRGKNNCKGESGCASLKNECRGKNECKGEGTSCDEPESVADEVRSGSCCSGKNECKGKSGCRSASNPAGSGKNACKGKGTSCLRRR